jgi:hypothetical protein
MINLNEEDWFLHGVKPIKVEQGKTAKQLALVIGIELVGFIGVDPQIAELFLNATNFEECSKPSDDVYCVTMSGPDFTETVYCNEKTEAILLSDPKIVFVDINKYKYAEKLEPGWTYENDNFTVPGVFE